MLTADQHIFFGWGLFLLGVFAGAAIGLFFHRENWAGGYGSFRRRMLRLGHISFFGLGFMNVMFGLTVQASSLSISHPAVVSLGLVVGGITMPLCCYLTAWKTFFRHFFPVPVLSVATAITAILLQ